jgi:hypothetical protein
MSTLRGPGGINDVPTRRTLGTWRARPKMVTTLKQILSYHNAPLDHSAARIRINPWLVSTALSVRVGLSATTGVADPSHRSGPTACRVFIPNYRPGSPSGGPLTWCDDHLTYSGNAIHQPHIVSASVGVPFLCIERGRVGVLLLQYQSEKGQYNQSTHTSTTILVFFKCTHSRPLLLLLV